MFPQRCVSTFLPGNRTQLMLLQRQRRSFAKKSIWDAKGFASRLLPKKDARTPEQASTQPQTLEQLPKNIQEQKNVS